MSLKEDLTILLNRYSMEHGSNTPDFILAEFLLNCLRSFECASNQRETWYGVHHKPGLTWKTVKGPVP